MTTYSIHFGGCGHEGLLRLEGPPTRHHQTLLRLEHQGTCLVCVRAQLVGEEPPWSGIHDLRAMVAAPGGTLASNLPANC